MRKFGILGAMVAVVAVSAFAAAGASANVWLEAGKELTAAKSAPSHGTLQFHNVLFGIETVILCSGLFIGTVGPKELDLVTLVESLSGSAKDLVPCTWESGAECTNPVLHAENLPWLTKLLAGTPIVDHFLPDPTAIPSWILLCEKGLIKEVLCEKEGAANFVKNGTNGAELEYTRASTETTCKNGSAGWITGKGEVLGFTIS